MVKKSAAVDELDIIEQDIIVDALNIVKKIVDKNQGQFTDEHVKQADQIIRAKWNGDRPYIAKLAGEGSSERNNAIWREYQRGERVCYLAIKHKLSPRHVERIIQNMKNPPK